MARPTLKIDSKLVADLAKIHCTMEEIASVCSCSVDTLERRFADIIKKGKDEGKTSLRRKQWQLAEGGDRVMLIWLGKQLLGQTDHQVVTTNVKPEQTGPIVIEMEIAGERIKAVEPAK